MRISLVLKLLKLGLMIVISVVGVQSAQPGLLNATKAYSVIVKKISGVYTSTAKPKPVSATIPTTYTLNEVEKNMLVNILTDPDEGGQNKTNRWNKEVITYSLNLSYPVYYQNLIRDIFVYGGKITGLQVQEITEGQADVTVVEKEDNGALTTLWQDSSGSTQKVLLEIGCCNTRAAWEDVLQTFGPTGDKGDKRSIFSQDVTSRDTPSTFDNYVLYVLYREKSGSTAAEIRNSL
jgi:hypothetical protein